MKKLLLFICSIFFTMNLMSQVSILSQTNVSCPGMCNGAVTLSITGGTMPYTLSTIIGPSSSCLFPPYPPFNSNTITVSGLCPCSYSFQVKDAGATIIGTVVATFTAPPPIVNTFSVQNICCNGLCNGAIYSNVTGGTPGYTYTWSPFGPGAPNYTGACAGNYTLTVKDSNGCPKTFTAQVTQPPPFIVSTSVTATSCSSCCNGSVNANGSGGNSPYSYTISPGGVFTNLCAGVYTICANDAGCCSYCTTVAVTSGSATVVQNISQSENISVVPNPSDGNFKILSQHNISQFNYDILDVTGKKIASGKATDNINIDQSADGVYILLVRNAEGEIVVRRKINVKH